MLGGLLATASGSVAADPNYPQRTIRLLYGFSGNEFATRVLAEKLGQSLGQPVIVENVPGAAGNIAADRAANAAPDGYTIGMLTGANIVLRPMLYSKFSYDPNKGLVPISQVFRFPNILAINNDTRADTLSELIALARAEPGKLTFGHLGVGSVTHLSGELLKVMAKIDIQGVPYSGPSPLLSDVIGGRVTMTFSPAASTLPLVQSGKLRALAVTSRTRAPFAPDIPAISELGYPDFETVVWFGLFAPAGTPKSILELLGNKVAEIMRQPEVRKQFMEFGQEPIGSSPNEFTRTIEADWMYWARLMKEAGIKPLD